jgi:hypothetical protein
VLSAITLFAGLAGCDKSAPPSLEQHRESQTAATPSHVDNPPGPSGGEHQAAPSEPSRLAEPKESAEVAAAELEASHAKPTGKEAVPVAPRPGAAATAGGEPPPHTFAPLGAGSPAATQCETDSDCTVSCYLDGRCCKELCGCSRVYSRAFASRLAAAVAQNCSPDVICPVARCRGTKSGRAVCEEGQCVLAKTESAADVAPQPPAP